MYDVNFGGIEFMTKRFTIALVALALFVLVAVMPVSAYYYTVAPGINQGATVFVGEQGLNLANAVTSAQTAAGVPSTVVGWWASAAQVLTTAPTKSIDVAARATSLTVNPADFGGYAGNWYLVDPATGFAASVGGAGFQPVIVFVAADPTLDLRIWDATQNADVTGKSVPQAEGLTFRIDTNMYQALTASARYNVTGLNGNGQSVLSQRLPETGDGYIDIKVKDESGAVRTKLVGPDGVITAITAQAVTTSGWYWASPIVTTPMANWSTDAIDATTGQFVYPAGTYTVWAESLLNNMKDNYRNAGADYTGKTVSQTYTVTIVSDTVKIEANKDTVVRSKPFSITVTGKPNTQYHVWVKGTRSMSGAPAPTTPPGV